MELDGYAEMWLLVLEAKEKNICNTPNILAWGSHRMLNPVLSAVSLDRIWHNQSIWNKTGLGNIVIITYQNKNF